MSKKCKACVYIAEYEKNHFLDKLKETIDKFLKGEIIEKLGKIIE